MAAQEPSAVGNSELAARVDALTEQVAAMAEELRLQREARETWGELADTMSPVARGAMDMASAELEDLSQDVSAADAARFGRTLARSLPQLEALLVQLQALTELAQEVSALGSPAMAKATEVLTEAESRGYFAFARQGGLVADRVVTEFTEDDVKALGDNIVTILNAIKEMTQPEVMGLVRRTAISVQDAEDFPAEPPSLLALFRSIRAPSTRRGLARVLAMLSSVG